MIVELEKVSKHYINGDQNKREVLKDINLSINKGDSLAIVGPSGCGKSTLLNIIGTLDIPSSGIVKLNNESIVSLDEKQLAKVRNTTIGFVFQMHHLLPQLNLLENVLLPTIPLKDKQTNYHAKAMELLDMVGLADRIKQRPGQLSGGECQRTAVVRALINSPQILLADEPTGSLDEESAEQVGNLLTQINKEQNIALLTVTHSMDLAKKMDRSFKIHNGSLENVL